MNGDSIEHVKVRVTPDGRLSRADAAAYLGYAPKTLADWKCRGLGPKSVQVGGRIFYRLTDLEAFRDSGSLRVA